MAGPLSPCAPRARTTGSKGSPSGSGRSSRPRAATRSASRRSPSGGPRPDSGWTRTGLGYLARLEQFLGGEREWRVGASLRSTVDPIEDADLTELENMLPSALF